MSDFSSLGLTQPTLDALDKLGFVQPTPIQEEAIPFLMKGDRDLVGLAQTGTGKTAAFGLPLIERIDVSLGHPQALVLAPTRELCVQITNELQQFAAFRPKMGITPVYGGADIRKQISELRRGAQLVVATPGRLRDLINRRVIQMDKITTVVLDEADEMLNMGFKEEIDEILTNVPDERRIWLFSATMPAEVRRLTKSYMQDPHEISVGNTGETNQNIDHQFIFVRPRERLDVLRRFIDLDRNLYALVFCRTRAETQSLADDLQREGYAADVLNGDLSQAQRDRAMDRFRDRRVRIMIATDVAARGLDVQGITHVFHFNIPDEWAYYTHRSGRTGRAGEKGTSILLVHPNDRQKLRRLDQQLKLNFTQIDPPNVSSLVEMRLRSAFQRIAETPAITPLAAITRELSIVFEDFSKEDVIDRLAARIFGQLPQHYQREALASLDPKASRREQPAASSPSADKTRSKPAKYQRIFINIGKKEMDREADFVEFICHFAEINRESIGEIDLQEKHTFFEIDQRLARPMVTRFKDVEYNERALRVNFDDGNQRELGSSRERSYPQHKAGVRDKKGAFPRKRKFSRR
ncbi:MAG: ATP-dependent RNA helicase [Bacteroidetes bacterium]|nr:MAG: ATP-dependent RNA helicase [Bacteroidota bacterium]PTM10476.1 MAG: ATP-dependent RNA helicase [Bacteroidota bacterium]